VPTFDPVLIEEFGETGPQKFRLGLAEIELVQDATKTGIFALPRALAGLLPERPGIHDVRAPILYGLIGGGMKDTEAHALVRRVFDPGRGSPIRFVPLAARIVDVTLDPPEAIKKNSNDTTASDPAKAETA